MSTTKPGVCLKCGWKYDGDFAGIACGNNVVFGGPWEDLPQPNQTCKRFLCVACAQAEGPRKEDLSFLPCSCEHTMNPLWCLECLKEFSTCQCCHVHLCPDECMLSADETDKYGWLCSTCSELMIDTDMELRDSCFPQSNPALPSKHQKENVNKLFERMNQGKFCFKCKDNRKKLKNCGRCKEAK